MDDSSPLLSGSFGPARSWSRHPRWYRTDLLKLMGISQPSGPFLTRKGPQPTKDNAKSDLATDNKCISSIFTLTLNGSCFWTREIGLGPLLALLDYGCHSNFGYSSRIHNIIRASLDIEASKAMWPYCWWLIFIAALKTAEKFPTKLWLLKTT